MKIPTNQSGAKRRAFFAYPARPVDIGFTIERAVSHKDLVNVEVTLWPQLDIFGSFIPDLVRTSIEQSDVCFFDVTVPNANVYYELGYAIGLGKPVGPVIDGSFDGAERAVQRQGLFDNVGHRSYENSDQLTQILNKFPKTVLLANYYKEVNFRQPVFFLDTYKKTDFRNTIVSAVRQARVFYRSFDPVETPRLSTTQLIGDLSSSGGVIVPLLPSYLSDASSHNLRAAFVAGLSHGLRRETLIIKLKRDDEPEPADFRDEITRVSDPQSASSLIEDFATSAVVAAQNLDVVMPKTKSVGLRSISLGAVAAENEFRSLSQYFVETSEFSRTVKGEINVVTGRKGSGKSAIFFQARDTLIKRQDYIVADLKPETHQLTQFREDLSSSADAGLADHTMSAFWYFVLVSEILLIMRKAAEKRFRYDSSAHDLLVASDEALGDFDFGDSADFTTRLSKLVGYFVAEMKADADIDAVLKRITNIIYSKAIPSVRDLIIENSSVDTEFVILFDNIDKGWPATGVEKLDLKMVRMLLEALVKIKQDFSSRGRELQSTVFLRNDIFELLIDQTPDRGKAGRVSIDWTDRQKLKQIILRRLQSAVGDKGAEFDAVWSSFFPHEIAGRKSFDYFVDHCLMRPRFLIAIIELAVANGINRGHSQVSEEDCIDAVRQYAYSLIDDFGYEIRDVSGFSAELMYAFVGSPQTMAASQIKELIKAAKVADDDVENAFTLMLWYGGLGVRRSDGSDIYIYDVEYKMKRIEAEMRRPDSVGLFTVNPALYVALT
jgi:energy-coupling factor transporter ATP-binding protein EcfA2